MYLKKIELNGFKSFAEPTVLEFPKPVNGSFSVTAVVGPNGSGKSNVSDALRWVMGEQSHKQLRGKKSEDVIFGGSEYRGKMSVASVSITLDNSDKRAPVEYSELVITRKVYRSGESEYSINGNQVRLIDLHILLAQAQFGQGSYSVIGQGTIAELLLQSSSERKNFFDEAVGIKEFQIKRHQAILKLQKTNEHIAQADLLLAEIEPRMKSLKRQVKKLEERKDIEIQLRDTQELYYASAHTHLTHTYTELTTQKTQLESEYAAVHAELDAIQIELATLAREESRQEQFEKLQQEHQALLQKKNDLERDRAVLTGKLHTEYSKVGKQNISWLENKNEQIEITRAKLEKEIEINSKQINEWNQDISSLNHTISELAQKKFQLQRAIVEYEKNMFDVSRSERMVNMSGYRAVEAILNNKNVFGGRVYGMVAELGSVEEKFQQALEVAAGSNMTSVVVEDDAVAGEGIAFLKQHHLGTATFLPVNNIRPRPIPHNIEDFLDRRGVYGLAIDLVEFDPKFEGIFSYVFGATLIVEDVDTARELGIGRMRMVTLDGDMMSTGGSMRGGYREKTKYGIRFSSNAKEMLGTGEDVQERLQTLRTEITSVEESIATKEHLLTDLKTQKAVLDHTLELLREQQKAQLEEQSQIQQELSLTQLAPDEYDDMMKELSVQKDDMTKQIDALVGEVDAVENKMKQFNNDEEQKRKRIFALQDDMQRVQNSLNAIATRKNDIHVELAKIETRREDLENEIFHEIKANIELVKQKFERISTPEELDGLRVEIEKFKYSLSLIGGIDEEVLVEYEETKTKYDNLTAELNDLKKASDDLETLIEELDKVMKKRHAESFKKIKKEFSRYFEILFEGGKAELTEVYGSDKDEEENREEGNENVEIAEGEMVEGEAPKRRKKILQGIDIVACPPGKKITNIAALSGGERTLTSIALVCAILHTNPPPFVLLDEVEAALDEANTVRFTTILQELSRQSQFILITHNRATMHAADVLYGVTMGNDGVSKLLSVKLEEAKKVVA